MKPGDKMQARALFAFLLDRPGVQVTIDAAELPLTPGAYVYTMRLTARVVVGDQYVVESTPLDAPDIGDGDVIVRGSE